MIGYGHQQIDESDIIAVRNVLESNFLTCGPKVKEFEFRLGDFTGYKYAVAVNSGTAALHCAIKILNLKPGDEVIVPSITFSATANVVLYEGGKVVFADVSTETLLIDLVDVARKTTEKTRAIIIVDMAGNHCEKTYLQLKLFCKQRNITLISDSCHSLGMIQTSKQNQVADIVCYSFHPVKMITTGEGGMVLTNNEYDYKLMKAFRNHGRFEEFNWEMITLGYNYRMPDINAALGISQLYRLERFIEKRRKIANKYHSVLNEIEIQQNIEESSYHLFIIKIEERETFMNYMYRNDISCQIHYKPVYRNRYYNNYIVNCPKTSLIEDKIVSIPIYFGLSDFHVEKIIELIQKFRLNLENL